MKQKANAPHPVKPPKITVRTLARATGYAPCTVARALSDDGCVALETRSRILRTARSMGYIRRSRTNLAVIIPPFPSRLCFYDTAILHALSLQLDQEEFRYELIPENHLRAFNEKMLDGAISVCYTGKTARLWSELNPIPLVCINDFSYHPDRICSVCSDDRKAMRSVAAHLHAAGHTRALFLETRHASRNLNHALRKQSFLEQAGLFGIRTICRPLHDSCDWGELLLRESITAVICPFEMTDLKLYAFLNQTRRIPEELELLCWHVPGITENLHMNGLSVEQDFDRLAEESVILLKQLMEGRHNLRDVSVPYRIARRSPAGNG